jgi:hypothetical protein
MGPDELADLFGQLIEEAADPVDVDRAVEAVVRLARSRLRVEGMFSSSGQRPSSASATPAHGAAKTFEPTWLCSPSSG